MNFEDWLKQHESEGRTKRELVELAWCDATIHFQRYMHLLLDEAGIPDETRDEEILTLEERLKVVELHVNMIRACAQPARHEEHERVNASL